MKTIPILMLTFLFCGAAGAADAALFHVRKNRELQVAGISVEARLTAISEDTFRISFLPIQADGSAGEIPANDFLHPLKAVAPTLKLRGSSDGKLVKVGAWRASVQAEPLVVRIEKARRLVQQIA